MPVTIDEGFDLLGNTVAVKVVSAIVERLAFSYSENEGVYQARSESVAVADL
jgi:hypothetical protein